MNEDGATGNAQEKQTGLGVTAVDRDCGDWHTDRAGSLLSGLPGSLTNRLSLLANLFIHA